MIPADYHKEREAKTASRVRMKDHLFQQILADEIADPQEIPERGIGRQGEIMNPGARRGGGGRGE